MIYQCQLFVKCSILITLLLCCGRAASYGAGTSERMVSLSPNITEILFELGLGSQVVGVTSFCRYPAETAERPHVGGYMDLHLEKLVSLQPDLVLLTHHYRDAVTTLNELDIKTLTVRNESIRDIHQAIQDIGTACGVPGAAETLTEDIKNRVAALRATVPDTHPRALVVVGREYGSDTVTQVIAAGAQSFHDEILKLAGAENAYDGRVLYPDIGREGLLTMRPDVIIEIVQPSVLEQKNAGQLRQAWAAVPGLSPDLIHHIHIISRDYAGIPGPRYPQLLELFIRLLYPDHGATE